MIDSMRGSRWPNSGLPKMGGVYNIHVFWNCLTVIAYASAALVIPIVMIQTAIFVDLVIQGFATVGQYIRLVGHSILFSFPVAFPIVQSFSIAYVLKLKVDSGEMAAMASAGAGPCYLAAPALMVAVLGTGVMASFCFYLEPVNNRAFYELRDNLAPTVPQRTPSPRTFLTFSTDVAIYYQDQAGDGALLGILIHDGRDKQRLVTVVAKRGFIDTVREGYLLDLYSGSYQVQEGSRPTTLKNFENMSFSLMIAPAQSVSSRPAWLRANERFLPDLLFPNLGEELDRKHQWHLVAYGHQLVARTLITFLLAVGATVAAMRFTSRNTGGWLLSASSILGLAAYFSVFWAGSMVAERAAPPLIIYSFTCVILTFILLMVGNLSIRTIKTRYYAETSCGNPDHRSHRRRLRFRG